MYYNETTINHSNTREHHNLWIAPFEKEDKEIATEFNNFFITKIEKLKENINDDIKSDPLIILKEKLKKKNLSFTLKTVSETVVRKAMKKMKNKKSAKSDGIPQDCLLLGANVLVTPITHIINTCISTGIFPEPWKNAVVIPILKKGDPTNVNNNRPVSCLVVASKILEKIVCNRITRYMEVNKLLPDDQHGFRAQRSTMSALTAMQKN